MDGKLRLGRDRLVMLVPGAPFIVGSMCNDPIIDPHFNSVILLMHMNSDISGWGDESNSNHTITPSGSVYVDNVKRKFNVGSAAFPSFPAYLSLSNSNFNMGSQAFTVEAWVNLESSGPCAIIGDVRNFNSQSCWLVYVSEVGLTLDWIDTSGTYHVSGMVGPVPLYKWVHVAVCVSASGDVRGYINGKLAPGTTTRTSAIRTPTTGNMLIGDVTHSTKRPFKGYMNELRVTKGVDRYNASFTPPCREFPGFVA
jgi:hypothetical protein